MNAPAAKSCPAGRLDTVQGRVDWLQYALGHAPPVEMPLQHRFTPGLYSREIFMPAGAVVVSKVHKTEHQFVVSKGRVSVWSEADGVVELRAPHAGVTKPGTRRILVVHEDTIWTTFHPTANLPGVGHDVSPGDVPALEKALVEDVDVQWVGEFFSVVGGQLPEVRA